MMVVYVEELTMHADEQKVRKRKSWFRRKNKLETSRQPLTLIATIPSEELPYGISQVISKKDPQSNPIVVLRTSLVQKT